MIKLENGTADAFAVVPLEITLNIKAYEQWAVSVARTAKRKAFSRTVKHKLDVATLEGTVKFITTAKLTPGQTYVDQQGIIYLAHNSQIFANVSTDLGITIYKPPTTLIPVSDTNIKPRTQLSL